jgi:hypothetical protein
MCWYWIGKLEYSLRFEHQAPNVNITIGNLSRGTLTRHVEVFGENNTSVETLTWLENSEIEALEAYRTPVSLGQSAAYA